jgi:hypothetical protein
MISHDLTPHQWEILGGDEDQFKKCVLCGALVLVVKNARDRKVPILAGFGPEYVEIRPAPECPPTCEGARKVWHEVVVEEVMIS